MQSLWMIFASMCFASASLTVKFASDAHASAAQIMCSRGIVAFSFIAAWCLFKRQSLRTSYPTLHLSRSLSGVFSVGLYTYSLTVLPLAMSVTLNYTASVWLAILIVVAALVKGTQPPRPTMLLCILASMVGVILLLKPIFATGQWSDAGIGLLSGVLSAVAYWQIGSLGKTGEPTPRIVFYHSLSLMVSGGIWWLVLPQALDMNAIPWLLANGVLSVAGQLAMTRALSVGKAMLVSNLMYLTVVFSSFLGEWFTHDKMDTLSYFGVATIVSCSIAATILNMKVTKKP